MVDRFELEEGLKSELDIQITDEGIQLPENTAGTECLANVANFLFKNDYLLKSDLPIKSGYKRYLINSEPVHQTGDEMFRPKELQQDLYIETNFNNEGIKRKIEFLVRISSD